MHRNTPRSTSTRALAVALLGLTVAPGCQHGKVSVDYRQVANWYQYNSDNAGTTTTETADEGMFMMYRITRVKNDTPNAIDFHFDSKNVYATSPTGDHEHGALSNSQLLHKANVKTVAAGQTANDLGCLILRVSRPHPGDAASLKDEVQAMKNELKDLLWHYDGTPSGVVAIQREASNNAVFYVEPGTSSEINKFCAVP